MLHLDVYWYNDLICEMDVDLLRDIVSFTNHTDTWAILPFMKRKTVTIGDFWDFVDDRVFPYARANREELLQILNLDTYDQLEILHRIHGLSTDDCIWVRFNKEDIDYATEIEPYFKATRKL